MRHDLTLAVAAFVVFSCGNRDEGPSPPLAVDPAATPQPATPEPAEPAEPPGTLHHFFAMANFESDALSDCMEIELTLRPPEPRPERWPPEAWVRMTARPDLPEGSIVLTRRCAEQFPDRSVLASCIGGR